MNTKIKIAKIFSAADERESILNIPTDMTIVNGKLIYIREYNYQCLIWRINNGN